MAADGYSVAEITRSFNARGLKTRNGAIFYRKTISRIIRNPAYCGDFISHQHYVNEHRNEVKNTGDHERYFLHNCHLPIVSHELLHKAQEALENRSRTPAAARHGKNSEPAKNHCRKVNPHMENRKNAESDPPITEKTMTDPPIIEKARPDRMNCKKAPAGVENVTIIPANRINC